MWQFAVLWCYVEGVSTVKVAVRHLVGILSSRFAHDARSQEHKGVVPLRLSQYFVPYSTNTLRQNCVVQDKMCLISKFRRVVDVVLLLVGDSQASEFYVGT